MPDLSPIASTPHSPRRILVVDDDPSVREMLRRVLCEAGYLAEPARNGSDAVRLVAETRIDVALLDLGLEGEDGWTVLKQLRARMPTLPVVIVTAWPNQHLAAEQAGANACFEKPLDFALLLEALTSLVPARTDHSGASAPAEPKPSAAPGAPAASISQLI